MNSPEDQENFDKFYAGWCGTALMKLLKWPSARVAQWIGLLHERAVEFPEFFFEEDPAHLFIRVVLQTIDLSDEDLRRVGQELFNILNLHAESGYVYLDHVDNYPWLDVEEEITSYLGESGISFSAVRHESMALTGWDY